MPVQPPYEGLGGTELILRDRLALDRTVLANERTLLAYVRTAFALVVAGISFLHFIENPFLDLVGALFIPLGLAIMVVGVIRFRQVGRRLKAAGN